MNLNIFRHVLNYTRSLIKGWYEYSQVKDHDWRNLCRSSKIPFKKVCLIGDGSLLVRLDRVSVIFPKKPSAFAVLSGYSFLHKIEADTGCLVDWDDRKEALVMRWGKATYLADSFEELHTLYEIYCMGCYDYTPSRPTVLIDIGANVGFVSIFLAESNPHLVVIACEPVPESYAKALRNLKENPNISHRVIMHNVGLFSEDGYRMIKSVRGHRVRSSFVVDPSSYSSATAECINVEVRRASSFVKEIAKQHVGKRVVVKMDCEGSEYEILSSLEDDDVLDLINGFIFEWHVLSNIYDDVTFFRTYFERTGFDLCIQGRFKTRNKAGLAYAFKASSGL